MQKKLLFSIGYCPSHKYYYFILPPCTKKSPSLHKFCNMTAFLPKKAVVQQCANGATTHSPNSSISSKTAVMVSGSEQASPGYLHHNVGSKDTQTQLQTAGWVSVPCWAEADVEALK